MAVPDMDDIVRQVAMDGIPSRLTSIEISLKDAHKKLDEIIELLEKSK